MKRLLSKRFDVSRGIRLLFTAIGFAALAMTVQLIHSGDVRAESAPPAASSEYDWMLAVLNDNRISGRVGLGASGSLAVNSAAGDNNVQANLRVINGRLDAAQRVNNPAPTGSPVGEDRTLIDGQAFVGARGALGVNQVAGHDNAQINTVAIGATHPIRTLEPAMPVGESDTAAREDGQSSEASVQRYRAVVADTAFTGFGGVLQINQVSGARNVTGNHFSISGPRP